MLIVDVRDHPDAAARLRLATVGIQAPHPVVYRLAVGEQPLRHALADDRHRFTVAAIVVIELAACQERNTKDREEPGTDGPNSQRRWFFTVCRGVAVGAEFEAGTKRSGIAPWDQDARCNAGDARKLADSACRPIVEVERGRAAHA